MLADFSFSMRKRLALITVEQNDVADLGLPRRDHANPPGKPAPLAGPRLQIKAIFQSSHHPRIDEDRESARHPLVKLPISA